MGVVTIRSFFLPSHPDKTPPIGVKIIPLIQVSAAKVEPSYSFKVTSSPYVSLSSFRFLFTVRPVIIKWISKRHEKKHYIVNLGTLGDQDSVYLKSYKIG